MLDVHGHNSLSARAQRPAEASNTSLNDWIQQQVAMPQMQVKSKLRGNNLYLLFEGAPCPDRTTILPQLIGALSAEALNRLLPPHSPPAYRVIAYGRQSPRSQPEWTESFTPHHDRSSSHPPQAPTAPQPLSEAAGTASQECNIEGISPFPSPARQGHPDAIARHLSDAFSTLGVAVRVKLEKKQTPPTAPSHPTPHSPLPTPLQRLLIACESAYSPDPLLFAEPIAERLRALELSGFQDAIVFGQVAGETRPEWVLRVDLTPPDDILKDWARWGDVQAIIRLLNRVLLSEKVQTSALLKEATLHLTCRSTQSATPDKLTTIATIVPLLEALSPQGIRAATIYGFAKQDDNADRLNTAASPVPAWVHWLDLSTDPQPLSTLDLAQQGNLDAIAFLLTRMLNPDLDRKLNTGGIRVQVRQKADLLHIMGEAPTCPLQSQMGTAIGRFLKPLYIPGIAGVRIYGRRSGQKQPLWSYGVDFSSRDRLVPEATPEFAVSDAYVGDLLSPPGALVLRTEEPSEASRSVFSTLVEQAIQQVQRSLVWSQLFVPLESTQLSSKLAYSHDLTDLTAQRNAKVAAIWSAIGLLLVVQSDWLLNRWLQPAPPAPIAATQTSPAIIEPPPQPSPFPTLSLKPSKARDNSVFNGSGFTQPGAIASSAPLNDATVAGSSDGTALPASPLRPKVNDLGKDSETYPTFNSRQFDEKLALYHRYLQEYGTPDVLIIGSSRAMRGVDPLALQKALADQGYTGTKIFNFGVNGATAQVVDMIVRQLLPPEKLPKLILWADGARAFNSGRADITYNGIVASDGYKALAAGNPLIPGTATAQVANDQRNEPAATTSVTEEPPASLSGGYQTVNQELNRRLGALSALYSQREQIKVFLRDGLVSLLPQSPTKILSGGTIASKNLSDVTSPGAAASDPASVLDEGQSMTDIDGFLPLSNQFNPATYYQKYSRVNGDYDSDYDSFSLKGTQTQALKNLVQFSQTHQIPLVFVNLPLTSDYLDPTRKRHEEDFQQHMLRLASELGFVYRDLNQALVNQPAYFSDPSHLNRYGAYDVSRRLAADVMIPWNQARK